MQVVFPAWQDGKRNVALAVADDSDQKASATAASQPATAQRWFTLDPDQVVRLAEDRAVLITTGSEVDEHGASLAGHPSPGLISAYWFKRDGERWIADGSQNEVDWIGFSGTPGKTQVVKLSANRFALSAEPSSCWQGYCGTWFALYELGAHKVTPLLKEEALASDNINAMSVDCEPVLKRPAGSVDQHEEEDATRHECYSVTGQWHIQAGKSGKDQPGDLVIDFLSRTEHLKTLKAAEEDEDGNVTSQALVASTIEHSKQRALYRYQNGSYKRVSGTNPVPSF
ncbi:hypothetical protein [Andreprevotia chitinilytica]|uniref:hypothetical protein n=1 Tax=Andreprevotia chitinilytica TaxID=396808 RepID=UPI00054E0FD9|nr:hypothetical protein [Andreprevotia chitinilytica]